MKLRGIEFGNVWGASGVQGFFGEGYRFHSFLKSFGLRFNGMTFVSKSATVSERKGHMSLTKKYTPKELWPDCIWINWKSDAVLNAVGLSNPGLFVLLQTGKWQQLKKPFFISLAPVGETSRERVDEWLRFLEILRPELPSFQAPVGLQLNVSCPNTGKETQEFFKEIDFAFNTLGILDVPLVLKINALMPMETAWEIAKKRECDALCVSNTIPFGKLADKIDWRHYSHDGKSPLAKFGGGGLSGAPLLPIVCDWIMRAREKKIAKPIIGGGGILDTKGVDAMKAAGASGISLGSVALLHPTRVQGIIEYANQKFAE